MSTSLNLMMIGRWVLEEVERGSVAESIVIEAYIASHLFTDDSVADEKIKQMMKKSPLTQEYLKYRVKLMLAYHKLRIEELDVCLQGLKGELEHPVEEEREK